MSTRSLGGLTLLGLIFRDLEFSQIISGRMSADFLRIDLGGDPQKHLCLINL